MDTAALVIGDEDRATLESWTRSRAIRASHVQRTRIVLALADGAGTSGAARQVGVSRPTVIKWRDRFVEHGIAGLDDEPRAGRPKQVDDSATLPPPESLQ
jgi:transposase